MWPFRKRQPKPAEPAMTRAAADVMALYWAGRPMGVMTGQGNFGRGFADGLEWAAKLATNQAELYAAYADRAERSGAHITSDAFNRDWQTLMDLANRIRAGADPVR